MKPWLRDCTDERLTLEVVRRYRSCKLAKIPSVGCKVPLRCVLTEKWELGHQEFITLLVVDCNCYRFVVVRGASHGED